jgi:hypothetical protein
MKWDEVNQRSITIDELDLDKLLDDEIDWVINMDAADISFKPLKGRAYSHAPFTPPQGL